MRREVIVSRLAARGAATEVSAEHGGPRLMPCAVLVPLVERPAGMTVLLTRRADHLARHAGQISFPGGRVAPGDGGPEATALREAFEEVGLAPDRVEVAGRLPVYRTGTGFSITPVVGLVAPPFGLRPDPAEVAEAFEVPLAFLLDPANRRRHAMMWRGALHWYDAFVYEDRYIWGATAGMIVAFASLIDGPC